MQGWEFGRFLLARANFYEVEYPDLPGVGPTDEEAPLGPPISEDEWMVIAGEKDRDEEPGIKPTITPLNLSSSVFVNSDSGSVVAEYDERREEWYGVNIGISTNVLGGGEWTVEVPGNDEFPELNATLDYTPTFQETGIEVIVDGDGVPTNVVWTPNGAQRAVLFILLYNPNAPNDGQVVCDVYLVDDGEVEIPPGCAGLGRLDIDPYFNRAAVIVGQYYEKDVAFADHRIRLTGETAIETTLVYPYEPPR